MNIARAWLSLINDIAHKIYIRNNEYLPHCIFDAVKRAFAAFLLIDLCFYIVERIIWGHGFMHVGDAILVTYLAFELASMTVFFLLYKRLNNKTKYS